MKLRWRGIIFDDWVTEGSSCWSQICKDHVEEYKIPREYLSEIGEGICGVEGCNEAADYYIDFPSYEIEIV